MPALDFGALLQQERARARRERAKANGDGDASAPWSSSEEGTVQGQQPPLAALGDSGGDQDAILAAALSKLAAAGAGGGEGEAAAAAEVDVMAVAAAKAMEEAKATKRLMQSTLPAGWLRAEQEVDLQAHALPGPPSGVYYLPDFVSPEIEAAVLNIAAAVPGKHPQWVRVRGRRLQCYGGEPTEPFRPEQLPAWVAQLCEALVGSGVFSREGKPNHVLLNEYRRGDGIMAHKDGPFYHSRAAILSLGGAAIFHFKRPRSSRTEPQEEKEGENDGGSVGSVVLQPRSLLVFTKKAYEEHLHEILAVAEEVVGMAVVPEEDGEAEGEGEGRVVRMEEGPPVLNLEAAGVKVGDVIRRGPMRVSLTFRRVRGEEEPAQIKE